MRRNAPRHVVSCRLNATRVGATDQGDGMADGSVAIGATVRAGFAGLGPSVRACWAALLVAVALSTVGQLLPPAITGLSLLTELAAAIVACGALYRRAFGRAAGFSGLRWGQDEWRLLAAQLLIGALFLLVLAILAVVVGGIALGVATTNAPGFDVTSSEAWQAALDGVSVGTILAGLAPLLSLALLLWLAARLSLAGPASVDQAGVKVLSAFSLTKGATPQILASALILAAPVVLLIALSSLVGRWTGPGFGAPLAVLGAAFAYFYLVPVWTGALVDLYRRRHAPAASPVRNP